MLGLCTVVNSWAKPFQIVCNNSNNDRRGGQGRGLQCQGKIEMSPSQQSRNVPCWPNQPGVRVNLLVPVKQRRALLASNPIEE